jgi:transcriptional regulator with XRE-family HTH domain
MSLKKLIKRARLDMKVTETREISVPELAEKLDVTPSYLYGLEDGAHTSASLKFLKKYAEVTGTSWQELADQVK